MKISKIRKNGFRLNKQGIWEKPIIQRLPNGKIIRTKQLWKYVGKCKTCKSINVSFHQASRYCSKTCYRISGIPYRKGKKFPNERGGIGRKRIANNGYVEIYIPGHPISDTRGRVLEHRLIIYNEIKRPLTFNDVVHHINGNRSDNRRENLVLTNRADHNTHHKSEESKLRERDKSGRFL